MDADPLRRGKPGTDTTVRQCHFVITRLRVLRFVAESLPVATVGIPGRAGIQLQRAGLRHEQDVAQVGVARAAEMRVAEAHDCVVRISVAGAIIIDARLVFPVHIVGDGIRVG